MDRAMLEKAHLASELLKIHLNGEYFEAKPKVFSTGSLGWYAQGKVEIGDAKCQFAVQITVIGSKPGWVPFSQRANPTKLNRSTESVQEVNGLQKPPERPPSVSPLFPEENVKKRSGTRSKRS